MPIPPDDRGAPAAAPRVVVAVPPGLGPGDALYVAYPVDVLLPETGRMLPPPSEARALPPAHPGDDPPRLAPPAAHQALAQHQSGTRREWRPRAGSSEGRRRPRAAWPERDHVANVWAPMPANV